MADKLFPTEQSPAVNTESEFYDKEFRDSWKWDYEAGDFARDGANAIIKCDGIEAYRTWCVKTAMTERNACLAYSSEIGAELEEAFNKPTKSATESALERTVREALMVNPRTKSVDDFEFEWSGDDLKVYFTVTDINTNRYDIEL